MRRRYRRWPVFLAVAALLLLGLSKVPTAPRALDACKTRSDQPLHAVYVVDHGKHTGLILPAEPLHAYLPELQARFGRPLYYEIGWGDSGFYQAEEITVGLTLNALFYPSASIVHVFAVHDTPEYTFGRSDLQMLFIDSEALRHIYRFVSGSFARSDDGRIIARHRGLYGDSQFYAGLGSYHLLNTCNKWTAKALHSGGIAIAVPFIVTSGQVMFALR